MKPAPRADVHGYDHILVVMDFSGASVNALEEAVSLGRRSGAEVDALHIHSLHGPIGDADSSLSPVVQAAYECSTDRSRLFLKRILASRGLLDANVVVEQGDPESSVRHRVDRYDLQVVPKGEDEGFLHRLWHRLKGEDEHGPISVLHVPADEEPARSELLDLATMGPPLYPEDEARALVEDHVP